MKTNPRSLALFTLSGSLAMLVSQTAQAQLDRLYVKGDVGGNLTRDTTLNEFFGQPLASNAKITFDPGIRVGLVAGYQLTSWFAVEGETGVMANTINSITGASQVDAWYSNVPLLFNVRLQCPIWEKVKPYIGGGVGGSFPVIDANQITIGGTSMTGSQGTAVFAYQAFAGVRFKLNEQMGLALEYHYLHSDAASWNAEFSTGTASNTLEFGPTQTHSLSIAFDYHF